MAGSIGNVDIHSLEERKSTHRITCLSCHSDGPHDREVDGLPVCGSQTKGNSQSCDNLAKVQHRLGNLSSLEHIICTSTVDAKTKVDPGNIVLSIILSQFSFQI